MYAGIGKVDFFVHTSRNDSTNTEVYSLLKYNISFGTKISNCRTVGLKHLTSLNHRTRTSLIRMSLDWEVV